MTRDRLVRLLADGRNPRGRSDAELEAPAGRALGPGQRHDPHPSRPPMPAAVLVPLVGRAGGSTVLLTRRTAHLAHHPGQISFPGGRLEPCDAGDLVACALRETEEEVGLARSGIEVVGRLDDYLTGTGFMVTPVVGLLAPPLPLAPDPVEVAEVFEVPLSFVLDRRNHSLEHREIAGRARPFWAMTWQDRLIWGATAGILVNLSELLANRDDP